MVIAMDQNNMLKVFVNLIIESSKYATRNMEPCIATCLRATKTITTC